MQQKQQNDIKKAENKLANLSSALRKNLVRRKAVKLSNKHKKTD